VVGEPLDEMVDPWQHGPEPHRGEDEGHERQQHLERAMAEREDRPVDHDDEHGSDAAGDDQRPQQPGHDRPADHPAARVLSLRFAREFAHDAPGPRPDRVRARLVTLFAPETGAKGIADEDWA
jgi:hypothetical protein